MPYANQLKVTNRAIKITTYAAILLISAVFFGLKDRYDVISAREQLRAEAYTSLNDVAGAITAKMTRMLLFARGLSGAVTLQPEINQTEFSRYAQTITSAEPGIVNVATIRDNRVELVYPYAENQFLVGMSLAELPGQLAILAKARETGESQLQGPIPLLQGHDGYLLREPVYLTGENGREFWGLVSLVFSDDSFFQGLGLRSLAATYDVALRHVTDGSPIYGDQRVFDRAPVIREIDVPGGAWAVAIVPDNGWAGTLLSRQLLIAFLLATFGAMVLAAYLFRLRDRALVAGEQLHTAINVLSDGFALYDAHDRLLICNDKYRELYSLSAPVIRHGTRFEEILRYGLDHGQYPEAVGSEEAWLEQRMRAHQALGSTFEQKLDDGRWLRVHEMATPNGGRVGIRMDITDQVASRERAELAERRLRDAIEAIPVGFWLFDAQEALVHVNSRAQAMLGDTVTPLTTGESLEDAVRRMYLATGEIEDPAELEHEIGRMMRTLRRRSAEFTIQHGPERWSKFYSYRTSEGGLVCFALDISQIVLHERWLQASNHELRAALKERDAAEARFAEVADISTEWFWEQDAEMRLTYLSPGFKKAMGVDPETVIGQFRRDMIAFDDEHSEVPLIIEKMEAHEPFQDVIQRTNLRGEAETWVRTSGRPVFDEFGRFAGYIGTAADVTPLYTALREARRADEAKTQFLNVISHELRTPMTIVLGFNAFLLNLETLPEMRKFRTTLDAADDQALVDGAEAVLEVVKRYSTKIQTAGDQLQHLIRDMLDLARIEAKTMRFDRSRVEAQRVVASIIDQMKPLSDQKGIELIADVGDVVLDCDETRLRQILTNLIGNAIKFTDEGHIAVRSETRDGMAYFHVEDTGLGIPREALPFIFERFTQADISSTRNSGGAGLGLAISKELVALQGGTIGAESVLGKGTRITFSLPCWKEEGESA